MNKIYEIMDRSIKSGLSTTDLEELLKPLEQPE